MKSASIKKKLIDDKDEAFMSKQLATIITNIPMEFNLKDCVVHEFDVNKVKKIFDELNFKSLNRKLDMLEKRVALFQRLPPMIWKSQLFMIIYTK